MKSPSVYANCTANWRNKISVSKTKQGTTSWWLPGICLILTGWCANQYVSLISWYQQHRELSEFEAMLVMGSYLLGMIPTLLLGGPLADKFGRKPFTLLALTASTLGSLSMMFGVVHDSGLYAGRVFTGMGMGLAMVAVTSWVKVLSVGPAGATRAALCTSAGFAIGPMISGTIVGASASPELAYGIHAVAALSWLFLITTVKEEKAVQGSRPGTVTTPENLKRFKLVVLPAAPWVFGLAASGFAIVPALSSAAGQSSLFFTTAAVVITMGMGVLVQPLAKRYNDTSKINVLMAGLILSVLAFALMILVYLSGSEALGYIAFLISGSANGVLLVAGLSQVLDLAGSGEIGKLTGRFYAVCFIGFSFPTLFAMWRPFADPLWFIALLIGLCLLSMVCVYTARKHLPARTLDLVQG
ncbi:MFS transporter [Glutamicibacter ardleyensis]|uniref:MFS transporter n=1 Tax=Glutamicibacter ardleyensis TaxID=225894 RepID=UPI003FD0DEBE